MALFKRGDHIATLNDMKLVSNEGLIFRTYIIGRVSGMNGLPNGLWIAFSRSKIYTLG